MSSFKSWQYTAIMGAILSISTAAQAQNVSQLENIVVTPSRIAQLESKVVGDVSVVTSEEIQKSGQTSVAEILAKQPGVQFTSNGGPQAVTGVYLRGAKPEQSLILVDGVRINNSTQAGISWNTINTSLIDRIEIVRGGASALYGADAMGGVINIITKKADENKPFSAWGSMGYGTYDTMKADFGLAGIHNGWDYTFSAFKQESEGFDASNRDYQFRADPDSDLDGYESHGFNAGLGYTFAPGHRLSLNAFNSYMNGDIEAGNGIEDYAITHQQVYSIKSENKFNDFWNSTLRFDFNKELQENRAFFSKYTTYQRNINWQNDFHLNENHIVSLLLERREDRVNHTNEYNKSERNTNSIGLSYLGDFNGFRTQASIRNDNYTDYGSKRTGSLGFDFDITDKITFGAVGSTSFRMPTFTDMYSFFPPNPWGGGFKGNEDLKPESAKSFEISAKYRDDNLGLSVTAYRSKIKDMILGNHCDPINPMAPCTSINIDRALIKGVTLAGDYTFGNTNLYVSADYLNPKDIKTGKILVRRAKQVYNFGVNHQIHNWNLGAEYQFVGKRYDDAANKTTLGGYGLANLTAQYDFNKNVSAQVRWNNVFNKEYHTIRGYNMPGSNVFLNLSFKM